MKPILLFLALILFSTGLLVFHQYTEFHDGYLHVIFCNVGQGDGIFIRTPEGKDIVLDGGPDTSILSCMTDHMPFWDRTVSLMFLSHPHADHLVGLITILKRYTVQEFVTENLKNKTSMFTALLSQLKQQHTNSRFVTAGDSASIGSVKLTILSPSEAYLHETSPGGFIGENKEFASLITHIQYGSFDVLLDGDSQAEAFLRPEISLPPVEVMQVPHHGSKTGLSQEVLARIRPTMAVISVGKNNYGHPSPETLSLLSENGIKTARTDKNGDIEIISDGKRWWVRR